ncbi:MAG: formate dehydrogenase accessory sulfurtransferase FdhD [Porticoccaceae bacterium]|nr:formate dehydrogenase accessory sulfurtransferase FdhD [Porticoccaceae bacterium]
MSDNKAGYRTAQVLRNSGDAPQSASDQVAVEAPVALVYNSISHVVMMATPEDLEDFAIGFSLTEGIIDAPAELYSIEQHHSEKGIELNLTISERRFQKLKQWRRNMTGRTGCGLCGAESLQQAIRLPGPLESGPPVTAQAIVAAMNELPAHQPINQITGATHAAAWADCSGKIVAVREDVGRHNALDKLIGALCKQQRPPGFLLVTSRASYEMVQKAGWANMGLMAAVSAPTSLAIELAEKLNITLLGFVRGENFVCYAHSGVFECP